MITITLTPEQLAAIDAQRGGTPVITPAPAPAPAAPPGVRIVEVKWGWTPTLLETVRAGETLAFAFTVPAGYSSQGRLGNFSIAPAGDHDYFFRDMCLATSPGDFAPMAAGSLVHGTDALAVYFSAGGYPKDRYGRLITTQADLKAGQRVYVNVRQNDPTLACNLRYGPIVAP